MALTLVFREDQLELTLDALEYLKQKLIKERPKLGDFTDNSGHWKVGQISERRIDEMVESLLRQSKAKP